MPNQAKKALPNFEEAMKRLEEIVEKMESGELPLEDLIVRYEEGMKLVKICQERLSAAEERIETISRDSAGRVSVKAFEPAAAMNASVPEAVPAAKGEPNDDDVSLF